MDYQYFKRDISWLSFNYRVLLEADDDTLPVGERLNFISIYSSNLEEFYKVRVADHKAVATGKIPADGPESVQEAIELVEEINQEVNRQLEERVRIFEQKLLPALRRAHVIFFQSRQEVQAPEHQAFVRTFFREEVLPYLAPVPVGRDKVVSFLRNDRLYLSVRVKPKQREDLEYFVMKLPYSKAPRFVELPRLKNTYYIMYLEDIIKANLDVIFPGYEVESAYCIKISRDADIVIDEGIANAPQLIEQVLEKVKRRKTGVICRFVYDRAMPADYLAFLMDAYHIDRRELVPGDKHLNLEDLRRLPLRLKQNALRPVQIIKTFDLRNIQPRRGTQHRTGLFRHISLMAGHMEGIIRRIPVPLQPPDQASGFPAAGPVSIFTDHTIRLSYYSIRRCSSAKKQSSRIDQRRRPLSCCSFSAFYSN